MRSPGPLFIVSFRGPRSNTRTASPSPVRATTSTAAIDLLHFHDYCYAERNGNTRACRVATPRDALPRATEVVLDSQERAGRPPARRGERVKLTVAMANTITPLSASPSEIGARQNGRPVGDPQPKHPKFHVTTFLKSIT